MSTRREVTAGGGNADAIAPHHSQNEALVGNLMDPCIHIHTL